MKQTRRDRVCGGLVLVALVALAGAACTTTEPKEDPSILKDSPGGGEPGLHSDEPEKPSSEPTSGGSDVSRRAAEARARLEQSEAGQLVLKSIERQGGLEAWYGGRTLRFRYAYRPANGQAPKVSSQVIELQTSRAYHDFEEPTTGTIAWDGAQAWSHLEDPKAVPARFWALTPYYFVAMPFVLADPGVKLEVIGQEPKGKGLSQPSTLVRATFEPGTGDAPDDYYIVYIGQDDATLLALRYVVSWKAFMAPQNKVHGDEKLLVYEGLVPAGPVQLASRQTFWSFPNGARGEIVTRAEVTDINLGVPFDEARLALPEGGVVDTSMDAYK